MNSTLLKNFKNPSAEFRSAPLWAWNHKISEEEIEFQLNKFKEQGMGGVFIHPRPGLVTEYLSDEWFKLCRFTLDKCKELGMRTWIYDENSFPSGFAGGHVPDKMPHDWGIALNHATYAKLPENVGTFKIVLIKNNDRFEDITQQIDKYKGISAEFYCYYELQGNPNTFTAGFPYVDLLAKGVTETFIDVTMTGYEAALGHEFGQSVPGVFTDEPNIRMTVDGLPEGSIRWTPDLFAEFEKMHGYQLQPYLPCLVSSVGNFRKARFDYQRTLLEMFIERWSKPWNQYCEKKNLTWTGHYWEHGWPSPEHCPDNMAMYEYHQMPGIDMLFNNREKVPDQFGNVRAVKEVASIANQLGKKRVLCETYGASGWDFSFRDMLRNGNWEFALGINFLNQHLSYFSVTGTRKYDFPQSFSYHAPWWEHYNTLTDYFARLSQTLSMGKQINKVLVISPTSTAWMYALKSQDPDTGIKNEIPQELDAMNVEFTALMDSLEKWHVEYDIGCEQTMMNHGSVTNTGKWKVGEREYEVVVIPAKTETLYKEIFEQLKLFVEKGGKVIELADKLKYINASNSNGFELLRNASENWVKLSQLSNLENELKDYSPNNIKTIAGSQLHFMRRSLPNAALYFVMNDSDLEPAVVALKSDFAKAYELDLYKGGIGHLNDKQHTILPGQGRLFLFSDEEPDEKFSKELGENKFTGAFAQKQAKQYTVKKEDISIKQSEKNVLTLDYGTLEIDGHKHTDLNSFRATDKVFEHYGFGDSNPWFFAVQFKTTLTDKDTFKAGTGFTFEYSFRISEDASDQLLASLSLVIENKDIFKVFVNGEQIKLSENEWWLERIFPETSISNAVKRGENTVKLVCDPMSVYAEIEPVYIRGNFLVEPTSKGFLIVPEKQIQLGDWTQQGLNFYPGSMVYSFIANTHAKLLQLTNWAGSTALVKCNGKVLGYFHFQNQKLPVDIQKGNEYQIEIVGSLRNTLGPFFSGEQGFTVPGDWKTPPNTHPHGNKYKFMEYGLTGNIILYF